MNEKNYPHRTGRRRFLAGCAAASMTPLLGVGGNTARATGDKQLMNVIPRSGELIPAVGIGSYQTFDVDVDSAEIAEVGEVLKLFADQGGQMVDSSPMYGRAEAAIGRAVADTGLGDRFFYATKVWTSGLRAGMEQMNQSFERMGVDVIDLMQVHNLKDTNTHLATMRAWREQGRIRYLGITHYTPRAFDQLERVLRDNHDIDFVQFPYSIAGREAENRLIPAARDLGVAVITHRNFEKGRLFGAVKGQPLPEWAAEFDCASWGNFFLKYVLGQQGVTNVIPATRKSRHLLDNMNAGLGRLPDTGQRERMRAMIESL